MWRFIKTDGVSLKSDVADLKADVTVLKTDVAILKTDMKSIRSELRAFRWFIGLAATFGAAVSVHIIQLLNQVLA